MCFGGSFRLVGEIDMCIGSKSLVRIVFEFKRGLERVFY